ncbi:Prephenate dehydratase-domain-containing protein [Vararia minispora EC-137]|uniref:Prephenate dehydratase-domain-containing protein n=1 Tax=Vararia minispora EC-137 TaxID=1314806 RepID=A0ACB8QYI7_9AGAM|nr:Prephenate dehydratase-domain-containing protein [Vararia minispora EC-137]
MQNDGVRWKLAFLGPVGTYSHQIAYDTFGDNVEYHARKTISEVFHSVNADFAFGILPQENSIFGSVVETYDLFRDEELGKSKWIRGALTLPVQHSLIVHVGKTMQEIKEVLSHEQALGQCSLFLQTHVPSAKLVAVSSTAGAAEMVSQDPAAFNSAAICSKFCTKLFPHLEVLHEGIQNENRNFTRFYVLANERSSPLPWVCLDESQRYALLRVQPCLNAKGQRSTINELMAALQLPTSRVDRRPSGHGPFDHVYILEVFSKSRDEMNGESHCEADRWEDMVQEGIRRVIDTGDEAALLGIW